MRQMLRRVVRGMGYLPGFGSHPGTPVIFGIAMLGFFAGGWIGSAVMLGVFGPFYVLGAYERAVEYERHNPVISGDATRG